MIRGYFRSTDNMLSDVGKYPYMDAIIDIPALGVSEIPIAFLIDTGADSVLLGTSDAQRLIDDFGVDMNLLSLTHSRGVGGQVPVRWVQAILTMGEFSATVEIGIMEPPPRGEAVRPIPSLLGRSVISRFGLIVDERTDRILLLDADEFDALDIPR